MRHLLRQLDAAAPSTQCLLVGDLNALSHPDYSPAEWSAHEAYNAARGWEGPVDEAAAGGVLALLKEAAFVDAHAALERPPHWRAPPWSAHVRDAERPAYRIDYAWSRAPRATFGRRLVPLEE